MQGSDTHSLVKQLLAANALAHFWISGGKGFFYPLPHLIYTISNISYKQWKNILFVFNLITELDTPARHQKKFTSKTKKLISEICIIALLNRDDCEWERRQRCVHYLFVIPHYVKWQFYYPHDDDNLFEYKLSEHDKNRKFMMVIWVWFMVSILNNFKVNLYIYCF